MTHDTVAASFILTWQLPRCQSAKVMHARAFGASRPAALGARPARVRFDIPIEARLEIRKYSDRS